MIKSLMIIVLFNLFDKFRLDYIVVSRIFI